MPLVGRANHVSLHSVSKPWVGLGKKLRSLSSESSVLMDMPVEGLLKSEIGSI